MSHPISPAAADHLDEFSRRLTRKDFEKAVLNQPELVEAMATAPATGWVPVMTSNTKWHYFREGFSLSACGAHYAGDVASSEEYFDGGHNSSDHCAKCRANRLSYLSTPVQS